MSKEEKTIPFRWIETDIPTTISHEEMGRRLDTLAKYFVIHEIVIKPGTQVMILAMSRGELAAWAKLIQPLYTALAQEVFDDSIPRPS